MPRRRFQVRLSERPSLAVRTALDAALAAAVSEGRLHGEVADTGDRDGARTIDLRTRRAEGRGDPVRDALITALAGSVGTIDAHDCPHGIVGEDGRPCEVDSSIDLATAVPPARPVRGGGGK